MGWIPGWPTDPTDPKGSLNPQAVVLHRTYGAWGGDYSVGKQGIFQFLIGKDEGRYVQFMSTESVAYHCNGANFRAFGVEIEGTNEDRLTDWQAAKLNEVLRYAHDAHGIPLSYQDPITTPQASISVNHSGFVGIIAHVSVATDDGSQQHTDYVTVADYRRAVSIPDLSFLKDLDMPLTDIDIEKIAAAVGGQNQKLWGKYTNLGDLYNKIHAELAAIKSAVDKIPHP